MFVIIINTSKRLNGYSENQISVHFYKIFTGLFCLPRKHHPDIEKGVCHKY